MEPPSTTLCAGYAGGLAAIVDRGFKSRTRKLEGRDEKTPRHPNQKTEGRKKEK
jgi:hypothetical protein